MDATILATIRYLEHELELADHRLWRNLGRLALSGSELDLIQFCYPSVAIIGNPLSRSSWELMIEQHERWVEQQTIALEMYRSMVVD